VLRGLWLPLISGPVHCSGSSLGHIEAASQAKGGHWKSTRPDSKRARNEEGTLTLRSLGTRISNENKQAILALLRQREQFMQVFSCVVQIGTVDIQCSVPSGASRIQFAPSLCMVHGTPERTCHFAANCTFHCMHPDQPSADNLAADDTVPYLVREAKGAIVRQLRAGCDTTCGRP
jgi:hypothetical protein